MRREPEGPDVLEARARAGEWLTPLAAARVLRCHKSTVNRWADRGLIGWRTKPGSRSRELDPADVVRLVDQSRVVHRAGE